MVQVQLSAAETLVGALSLLQVRSLFFWNFKPRASTTLKCLQRIPPFNLGSDATGFRLDDALIHERSN